MIKNRIVLLLLISASTVINSMHNKPFSQNQSLQKPLEFCKHALDEMNRRNISKADVTNVLSTTNLIKKQKHGRYCFTEQSDSSNPLQVILIILYYFNAPEGVRTLDQRTGPNSYLPVRKSAPAETST